MTANGLPPMLAVANNWDVGTRAFTGTLEVIRVGTSGQLEHNFQTALDNGWFGWTPLPGGDLPNSASEIALGQNGDGRLEVFVTDSSHTPWHNWQVSSNNEVGWSGWAKLPTAVVSGIDAGGPEQEQRPVLAQNFRLPQRNNGAGIGENQDMLLEVFASYPPLSGDGDLLLHAWQVPFGGTGGWMGWVSIAGAVGEVAVAGQNSNGDAATPDGRLEVLTLDGGDVFHLWQDAPEPTTSWSGPQFIGDSPSLKQLALAQNFDGRLEAFGVDGPGSVFHAWQNSPDDSESWSTWFPLGSGPNIDNIAAGQNADGHLEVIAIDTGGNAHHVWQTPPGGAWNNWVGLPKPTVDLNGLVVANNADGRLEVFGITGSHSVQHIWQDPTGPGGWAAAWEYL